MNIPPGSDACVTNMFLLDILLIMFVSIEIDESQRLFKKSCSISNNSCSKDMLSWWFWFGRALLVEFLVVKLDVHNEENKDFSIWGDDDDDDDANKLSIGRTGTSDVDELLLLLLDNESRSNSKISWT